MYGIGTHVRSDMWMCMRSLAAACGPGRLVCIWSTAAACCPAVRSSAHFTAMLSLELNVTTKQCDPYVVSVILRNRNFGVWAEVVVELDNANILYWSKSTLLCHTKPAQLDSRSLSSSVNCGKLEYDNTNVLWT